MERNLSYAIGKDHILWLINEESFRTDLPAFVFIFICMILGIFGNSLTVYVYHFCLKRHTKNIYITWLAVFDLVSCSTSIPYELFDLRFPMVHAEAVPCKLFRTIAFFTNMCSCVLLLVIAFDRYFATHNVLNVNFEKTTNTKLSIFFVFMIAAVLSFPAPFIFGTKSVRTPFPDITGTACSFDGTVVDTVYPTIYYIVLGITFFASFIILGIVYIKIALTIYHWKHTQIGETKESLSRKHSACTMSDSSEPDDLKTPGGSSPNPGGTSPNPGGTSPNHVVGKGSIMSQVSRTDSVFTVEDSTMDASTTPVEASCFRAAWSRFLEKRTSVINKCRLMKYSPRVYNNNRDDVEISSSKQSENSKSYHRSLSESTVSSKSKRERKRHKSVKERASVKRSNALFVSITIAFVLSYLPFLLLEVLKQVGVISSDTGGTEKSIFELFTKSIYLNNVINPFIYGILNPKFRKEIKLLFTGKFSRRRNSAR